jgi:hypothetical protein
MDNRDRMFEYTLADRDVNARIARVMERIEAAAQTKGGA